MKICLLKTTIPFLLVSILYLPNSSAQQVKEEGKVLFPSPFIAHSSNFLMALFNLNKEEVQPLLPEGMRAKINESGQVTAGFEMYETDRISGIPNYLIAFIYVEVTGLNSKNGAPGHWAIWGNVTGKTVLNNFKDHFNFPYELEEQMSIVKVNNMFTGTVGSSGREKITLKVDYQHDKPFSGEGIVNMYGENNKGQVVKTEVPWLSSGSFGNLVSLEINPMGNKALELIKDAKPFVSIISTNQSFSYSIPIVQ